MSSPITSIGNASNGLAGSVQQANETVHGAIDTASAAVRAPVDRLADGAHKLSDRATAAASQAAEYLDGATTKLKNSPEEIVEYCRTYIKEKPFQSIGIAAGVGLIAGLWIRGR